MLLADFRWATSCSNTSTDPRTYDEVSNEDTQVSGSEANRQFAFGTRNCAALYFEVTRLEPLCSCCCILL